MYMCSGNGILSMEYRSHWPLTYAFKYFNVFCILFHILSVVFVVYPTSRVLQNTIDYSNLQFIIIIYKLSDSIISYS